MIEQGDGNVVGDKRIAVGVRAVDELDRARFARQLRALREVRVVRPGERADVEFALDADGTWLRRLTRETGVPVVLVASGLGETELMAITESGVRSVLWRARVTPGRLSRAVHEAVGCCAPPALPPSGPSAPGTPAGFPAPPAAARVLLPLP
ncbi:DNA-binding response regulator [Streptomyces gamaensis]|uniref:DNA-binding response regulator n=1 Tax=Streptomyces gamaensis TaxID=1763542 RepID=A0ABW0YWR7_9ACTN